MPVAYDELGGSPTLTMDRKGGTGKRVFKINWGDIKAAITEVFPSTRFGWLNSAAMPGYPWLRAQSLDIEPWDAENPAGTNDIINRYLGGAKMTVNYAPNTFEEPEDSTDGEKPGAEEIVFLDNEISVSGEYLTWPNQGVRWERNASAAGEIDRAGCVAEGAAVLASGTPIARSNQVSEEIKVGIIIPLLEHSLTWNQVPRVPWAAIRSTMGRVNKLTWAGSPPGTLLFAGATASRQTTQFGAKAWKLTYKISEKNLPKPKSGAGSLPADPAIGWNHFLRPIGTWTRWDRLMYGPNCQLVYPEADFSALFRSSVPIDAGSFRGA